MSLATDILAITFVTQGVESTVSAFHAVENAQRRLAQAEARQADLVANNKDTMGSANALINAQATATQVAEKAVFRYAGVAVAAFQEIVSAAREATEQYEDYTNMVMNLRDITGSTSAEAGKEASLFRVAHITDVQAMRDILRMSRDTQTPQGQAALQKYGVDTNGKDGIQVFNELLDKMGETRNSIEKTADMQKIYGVRGVHALLPLLRMRKEERDMALSLSSVTDESLEKSRRFQVQSALLQETLNQKLVFPLAAQLMDAIAPALPALSNFLAQMGRMAEKVGLFDKLTFVVDVASFSLNVMANILKFIGDQLDRLSHVPILGQFLNAFAHPFQFAHDQAFGKENFSNSNPMQAHTEALRENTAAMRQMTENWGDLNHSGIPKGLNGYDVEQLARQWALGAIG